MNSSGVCTPFVHVQFHSLSSIVSYYAGVFAGIFRPFKRLRDELFYVFLELARRKCTKLNTEIRRQHRPRSIKPFWGLGKNSLYGCSLSWVSPRV